MKKRIGILYICTGPYVLFWEDFYKSFEEKFISNYEKEYFVFTDAENVYAKDAGNVHIYELKAQPWPLITLFRFATFLSIEKDMDNCDYLMFSNANMICNEKIEAEEFLPIKEDVLSVTTHPGYFGKSIINYPYDRNKKSLAYVPWNCGHKYVIGAMFVGTRDAFLNMSRTLKNNIEEDLKHNIIARWHDESHLNRYIINKSNIRILGPQYCYPYGMDVKYERKISAVSKQDKFDVKTFKGQNSNSANHNKIRRILGRIKRSLLIKERFLFIRDSLLLKTVKEIKDEK